MARLGVPQSKDTLLRSLKCCVNKQAPAAPVRVVGVDDWSWPWPIETGVRSRQGAARRRQDAGPDRPRDRVQLAYGPEMDPAGRIPPTGNHGTEADDAGRV